MIKKEVLCNIAKVMRSESTGLFYCDAYYTYLKVLFGLIWAVYCDMLFLPNLFSNFAIIFYIYYQY